MPLIREPKEGADFPEGVKLQAKRLAAFECCICHNRGGDEVHHIKPKAEGGTDDLDNAVFLCAQCHTDYGTRPEKRKFIREVRDFWYETVRNHYRPDSIAVLERLNLTTKIDLEGAMQTLFDKLMLSLRQGSTTTAEVVNVASTMVSSISASPAYLTAGGAVCSRCGAGMGLTTLGYKCGFCDP